MVKFSFSKKLRLLVPAHFTFVFQKPQKVYVSQIAIFSRRNLLGYPRIGLTFAKKHIRRAHERNRIKRLIRESFRLYQHDLPSMDFVVIAKKGVLSFDNHTFLKVLERLWRHYRYMDQKS